jgi:hypothetical protein
MQRLVRSTFVGLGLLLGTTLSAHASDAPPRSAPPPRPEVGGLLDRLLAEDAGARLSAEAALSKASPDVLKILLLSMRDRAARAEAAHAAEHPAATPAEVDAPRSGRGVEQDVRVLEANPTELPGTWGASDRTEHRLLTEVEAKELLEVLHRAGTGEGGPQRITSYDRQSASLEIGDQRAYVADFEFRRDGDTILADPVVRTLRTGLKLGLAATILQDGSTVAAGFDLDLRRRSDPMEEEALPAPASAPPVRVQRPEVTGWIWSRTYSVPKDRWLLVVLPAGFGAPPSARLFLFYRAHVVPLDTGRPSSEPEREEGGMGK